MMVVTAAVAVAMTVVMVAAAAMMSAAVVVVVAAHPAMVTPVVGLRRIGNRLHRGARRAGQQHQRGRPGQN